MPSPILISLAEAGGGKGVTERFPALLTRGTTAVPPTCLGPAPDHFAHPVPRGAPLVTNSVLPQITAYPATTVWRWKRRVVDGSGWTAGSLHQKSKVETPT